MTYKAKIYKITCSCCDKIYVGSTKDYKGLNNRMFNHRSHSKSDRNSKLYIHMREKGLDKFNILLIESVEVEDMDEQRKIEHKYIEELDTINNGLNTRRAFRSSEVKKQMKKITDAKYNHNNRDKINTRMKNYRDNLPISYICDNCNFASTRKDSFVRHKKSVKHKSKCNLFE